MERNDLILNSNGLEINVEENLDPFLIKKLAIAYGTWLKNKDDRVILGRDTRPSGQYIEKLIIDGLIASGIKVFNVGICPTPVLVYAKNKLKIAGGIIIADADKPSNWNRITLLSKKLYLNKYELSEISAISNNINSNSYYPSNPNFSEMTKAIEPIPNYIHDIYNFLPFDKIKKTNNLRMIIDPGGGAAKLVAPKIVDGLGCDVLEINKDLDKNENFPRNSIFDKENLGDLILALWKGNYDVGFAFNFDASSLSIIGNDFELYSDEIGFALIIDHYLKNTNSEQEFIGHVNLSTSLRLEALAEKYSIKLHKSYQDHFMQQEREEEKDGNKVILFSCEGLYGGPIFPQFNMIKDPFFIASKLIEIMVDTKEPIATLFSNLPKYYTHHEKIDLKDKNMEKIINGVKKELIEEGEYVSQFGMSLRFGHDKDWYVLITPSDNSLHVKSEAKRNSLSRLYCETAIKLIKLVLSNL
ncbi:MAG: hypothetical protein EU539_07730 [Promethearchaeota archaeon]|nr:MAG: hypothetical protein EU539_07730 [Candidatus Lokiarchaeota archaeon]